MNSKTLCKGMGYCWSVAVTAHPEKGKKMMEKWLSSNDKDMVWIMRSNLKKNRLVRMDDEWVQSNPYAYSHILFILKLFQPEREYTSFSWFTCNANFTVMCSDDTARYSKSKSTATCFPSNRPIYLVKFIKYL